MQFHKRAVILTADKFEDLELFYPLFRLLEAGWQVDIAAPNTKEIGGEHGYTLKPTLSIDEVRPDDYALLIIPGGFPDGAPATVRKNKRAQEITREFFQDNKPIASICHGRLPPPMLSKIDISLPSGMTASLRISRLPEEYGRIQMSWWMEIL